MDFLIYVWLISLCRDIYLCFWLMLLFFINKNVKKNLFVCYNYSVRYIEYCLNIMFKFFVFRIVIIIFIGTGKMME